jgi:hypothetical protein
MLEGGLSLFARTVGFGACFRKRDRQSSQSLAARGGTSGTALRRLRCRPRQSPRHGWPWRPPGLAQAGNRALSGQRDDDHWHSHDFDPDNCPLFRPPTCPNAAAIMGRRGVDRALGQRHKNGPVGPQGPAKGSSLASAGIAIGAALGGGGNSRSSQKAGGSDDRPRPWLARTTQTRSGAHA